MTIQLDLKTHFVNIMDIQRVQLLLGFRAKIIYHYLFFWNKLMKTQK